MSGTDYTRLPLATRENMKVGLRETRLASPFQGGHLSIRRHFGVTLEAALLSVQVDSSAIMYLRLNEIGC
jgi:hypothetical protein